MTGRLDRWGLGAIAVIVAGMGLRLAASFPLHKYPADADAILAGLCGRAVLRGEAPVFFAPLRIGSLECHLAAPLLAVFGPSRLPLTLAALALALVTLIVAQRFFRTFLPREIALLALLFIAVPPPAVLFWTYMLNGYPTVLLLCVTTLWLAVRAERGGLDAAAGLWLGGVAGLGFWHSFLTLGCTLPAIAWLLWRRRRDLPRRRAFVLAALAAALLGAAPWIVFNARHGFVSLTASFSSQPAGGSAAVLDNSSYLARHSLPELLASIDPENLPPPEPAFVRGLRVPVLAIYAAAALAAALRALPRRPRAGTGNDEAAAVWRLLLAVAVTVMALNMFSAAGGLRGLTVRYVLPLVLVAAPALALWIGQVARRSRLAATALATCVLAFDLCVSWRHQLPAAPRRQLLRSLAADDARLLAILDQHGVGLALGTYWMVYPIAFLSDERVIGVPCQPGQDHYRLLQRVERQGVPERWALVAAQRHAAALERWASAAGLEGSLASAGGFVALLPRNPPARPDVALIDRTLAHCAGVPGLGR